MKRVRGETQLLHKTFMLSIGAKGLFGLVEIIGAALSFVISPAQIHAFAHWITAKEIQEDPHAVIAQFLLHVGTSVNLSQTHYVAFYLGIHGLVKVLLVWALLRDKRWAYPWMLVALIAFIATQTWQMVTGFSWGIAFLTAFDVFILWLTYREWNLHPSRSGSTA